MFQDHDTTCSCIHLKTHEHLVATSLSRKSKDMAHDLIRQKYEETPTTTPSTLPCQLVRYLLHLRLLSMVMNHNQVARGGIWFVLGRVFPFTFLNIWNWMNNLRLRSRSKCSIDRTWNLKGGMYNYIQNNNNFLGNVVLYVFQSRCPHTILLVLLILWGVCIQ